MDNASPFQAAWQWRKFATCHLLALLLLILWLWGPTRELMNGFDFWLFDKLNGSLALNETWLKLWGLLSTRPFDAVVGVILLCLLIRGDWLLPANQVRRLTFGFIVTLLILVVIRVLYAKIAHHLHWQHASLSMLMDKAIHLSDHFPDWERVWEIKDRSKRSFPGDHASVLLVWALFMSLFARRAGQFLLIWALAVLFMLPRLVAGAHWGQDDYIGGLQMALLALAWGLHTAGGEGQRLAGAGDRTAVPPAGEIAADRPPRRGPRLGLRPSRSPLRETGASQSWPPRNWWICRRCFLLGRPSVCTPSAPALRMAAARSRLSTLSAVSS